MPKQYIVTIWSRIGEVDGLPASCPKYVANLEWSKDPRVGATYELTPIKREAQRFGRDTALHVLTVFRARVPATVSIEEAA